MSHKFYRVSDGAIVDPIDIVTTEGAWADWMQAASAGEIVWTDGSDTEVTDSFGAGDVVPGPIKGITSSDAAVRYGTGPLPIPAPTTAASSSATSAATSATNAATSETNAATSATAAASSATAAASSATSAASSATNAASSATAAAASVLAASGIQKQFAADSLAADTTSETVIGSVFGSCNVDPIITPQGTLTSNDSNYGSIVFKLYHAGSATHTWTLTTKTGGGGGTGNWVSGTSIAAGSAQAAVAGDWITVAVTKTGSGVALPAHGCGVKVS